MPKKRSGPTREPSERQGAGRVGARAAASLSAFGFEASVDVELSPQAAEWMGAVSSNAAWAGFVDQVDPRQDSGRRVYEWLTGKRQPKREELVEVARQLPDDHTMLEILNDLGARLANIRDAVGEKSRDRKRGRRPGGGGKTGNQDGDDAAVDAPAEGTEESDQGGVSASGAHWRSKADSLGWQNSTDFADLDSGWGSKAETFVEGLRDSGARVTINAGLRHKKRAVLMHYAWKVANSQVSPQAATSACQAEGIQIDWDHGDLATSVEAAQGLVDAFGLVACASLTSNHISGLALDMTIENVPEQITVAGQTFHADMGAGGQADEDKVDHIGEEFGVIWYGSGDWVHWSHTGG